MTVNSFQVGGDHYVSKYQVWDLVINTGMGFLEGTAVKYIHRWRRKDGIQDLKKALHYINKLLENLPCLAPFRGELRYGLAWISQETNAFLRENPHLTSNEKECIRLLSMWSSEAVVIMIRDLVLDLIDEAEDEVTEHFTDSVAWSGDGDMKGIV